MLFGKKKEQPPKVYTEQTCTNCGEKTLRSFEDGDYVFKSIEAPCSKCSSSSTIVSGVYGEYPKKPENS